MRKVRTLLMSAAWAGLANVTFAGGPMVVVELYTSQGCSSCPPADEILTELAQEDDIIALGLHVDYWDYLGWKDEFAIAAFSDRQLNYNMVLPSRYRLVTPQTIVHGIAQVAGGQGLSPQLIKEYIEKARMRAEPADLKVDRQDKKLVVSLSSISDETGPSVIQLAHFQPKVSVDIKRGENRGRKIEYTNIVSGWKKIGDWDGKSEITMSYDLESDQPLAVIVQTVKQGPVLVARKLP